jgi:hypothetical protein
LTFGWVASLQLALLLSEWPDIVELTRVQREGTAIIVRQVDNASLGFLPVIRDGGLEKCRVVTKKIFVDEEIFDVCTTSNTNSDRRRRKETYKGQC